MARFLPFRALRPAPTYAAEVASVPYDVVSREEALRLVEGKPRSYLHITRPEIDLGAQVDPHSDAVYRQGRKTLERFMDERVLQRDEQPRLYVYELRVNEHRQCGFVGLASIDDYENGIVRKHELTRPDKEDDRVRHMELLGAQSGTVFLAHRDSASLSEITQSIVETTPDVDFVAEDGVAHRVWTVSDSKTIDAIVRGFDEAGPIYVADGHHRSAAAARVSQSASDPEPGFLSVSFPASEVRILAYNRYVKDLNDLSSDEFLSRVGERFDVQPGRAASTRPRQFEMRLGTQWHTLQLRGAAPSSRIEGLDVALLQNLLLKPVLGIDDPRTSDRIAFIGGIRGYEALESRAASGGVAFALHPTSMEDLLAIADEGGVMPPKSTWFEPKLRDGLFTHLIETS